MVPKPLSEAVRIVGVPSRARRALHYEPAPPKIAQALHQPAAAIGNSLIIARP